MRYYITLLLIILAIINLSSISSSDCEIEDIRLPWTNTLKNELVWENSGCLTEICNKGGQEIDVFIDVTKDLDNPILGNTLCDKLNNILGSSTAYYPNLRLLFYFPAGYYEIDSLEIRRPNVILKGESAENTEIHFTKEMFISIASDGNGTYLGRQREDLIDMISVNNVGFEDLKFTVQGQITVFDQQLL